MYDYGWRHYMPDIGRWNGIDQLSEMYAPISPYAYVTNNPINFIDPDGRRVDPIYKDGKIVGWTFTEGDAIAAGGYLKAGGDWKELISQVESYGGNFGSGPLSNFWKTFNSNGLMIKTMSSYSNGKATTLRNGTTLLAETVMVHKSISFDEWMKEFDWMKFTEQANWLGGLGAEFATIKGVWDAQEMYAQGIRLGINGNYQLVGRNMSLFGKTPATKATMPISTLAKWGKLAGVAGFALGTVMDIKKVDSGEISGAKFKLNFGMGAIGFTAAGLPASILYGTVEVIHPQGWEGYSKDYQSLQTENAAINPGFITAPYGSQKF